jgi:hypothetical protein
MRRTDNGHWLIILFHDYLHTLPNLLQDGVQIATGVPENADAIFIKDPAP